MDTITAAKLRWLEADARESNGRSTTYSNGLASAADAIERLEREKNQLEHDKRLALKWASESDRELTTLRARVAKMEEALGDLLSWFPDCPSEPEWRLKAGRYGADDALAHARSLLTEEPKP